MQFRINLMPWRQVLYAKQKRSFMVLMVLAVTLGVIMTFVTYKIVNLQVDHQNARNAYLKERLIYYSALAQNTQKVKKTQETLLQQIGLINQLENNRSAIVHIFDLIPKILPQGVYLTEITKSNNQLSIYGMTESNSLITDFMRQVSASQWMKNPQLYEITSDHLEEEQSPGTYRKFSMTVDVVEPTYAINE